MSIGPNPGAYGRRELRDPSRPPPVTRPCLRCRKPFPSDGPHNRLCAPCAARSSELSPYAV